MAIDVNQPQSQRSYSQPTIKRGSIPVDVGDRSDRFIDPRPVKRRMIVGACALQKHGKDHWACSAPGPIGLHALDPGWEEPVAKWRAKGKVIKVCEYNIPDSTGKRRDNDVAQTANDIWEEYKYNYVWSLKNFQTVICDTSTELWQLIRLAKFGAESTGQTENFGPVNDEFRRMVREAYNHEANVIFLQKLGKKYVNREWNGDYEPKGWGDMLFEVQVVIRLWREDPAIFHTTIEDCRQDPQFNGQDYVETDLGGVKIYNDFPAVASMIYKTSREEWM